MKGKESLVDHDVAFIVFANRSRVSSGHVRDFVADVFLEGARPGRCGWYRRS